MIRAFAGPEGTIRALQLRFPGWTLAGRRRPDSRGPVRSGELSL